MNVDYPEVNKIEEMRGYKVHCLAVPVPAQGHMNPMLQLCKRLQHKGVKVTLATTRFIFNTTHKTVSDSIALETISDGYDEGGIGAAEDSETYSTRFKQVGSETLGQLVDKLGSQGCRVDCIIYDPHMPWVLDVAKRLGLLGAAFFTQSCAVDNIYYHVHHGLLKLPLGEESEILVPGLSSLEPWDMPSFIYLHGSYPAFLDSVVNQFSNLDKADWVLCNTFYKLEEQVVEWMGKLLPLRTVGPTIPSWYMDRRIQDDKDYGLSVYQANTGCMKWLSERQNGSVVYVSFGSLAELGAEQTQELAWGLRGSKHYFLWVVRASQEAKLAKDCHESIVTDCFINKLEKGEKGLVVSWCPQLEVLAHKAIGCFVTHCGWNSTLEALSLGVPMVAMPQWTDQTTNAKYVVDVWKTGVKAPRDDKGVVRQQVVEHCVREVMEGERGEEIRRNATKWKELAREAVDEGGSSDKNIDDFVAKLQHQTTKSC